jgi:hypothetical protein
MTDDRTGVESDEAFLIRYLAERDEPCPLCGYDLRALTSPRCPECGEALRAGVGLAQPQVMAWVALTAPLVASAGIALFMLLLYAGRGSLPSDYRYPYLRWALVYFWGVAAAAVDPARARIDEVVLRGDRVGGVGGGDRAAVQTAIRSRGRLLIGC